MNNGENMFIRYQKKWSHGIDRFEWIDVGDGWTDEDINVMFSNMAENWNWSEHWRGIKWERDPDVSVEVIKQKIEEENSNISMSRESIRESSLKIKKYKSILKAKSVKQKKTQ